MNKCNVRFFGLLGQFSPWARGLNFGLRYHFGGVAKGHPFFPFRDMSLELEN